MSLNDTMTNLMNAARASVGINGKLTLPNATKELEQYAKMQNELLVFPEMSNDHETSRTAGLSQIIEFDNSGFFELLPSNIQYLEVKKGDRIRQSFLLKTVSDINNFKISFYADETGHQFVSSSINRIGENLYKVSSDYTCIADARIRLFDFYEDSMPKGHLVFQFSQPFAGFVSKLGGVIKSLLCAVRQHFSPSLIGGVA